MKTPNSVKKIYVIIILLSIICSAFYYITTDFSFSDKVGNVVSIPNKWYYFNSKGNIVSVSLPCVIDASPELTLYYDGDPPEAGTMIATYAAVYNVKIYMDDELVYAFDDEDREINDAVRGNIVCSATLRPTGEQHGLRLVYRSKTGHYSIPKITLSTDAALVKSIFGKSLFSLIVALSMIILGLLAVAFAAAMALQKEGDPRVFCIGAFLIVCGLWSFSDLPFLQYLLGYNEWIFSLDFVLFMAMPASLGYYVIFTGDMRRHKLLHVTVMAYYINIIVQLLFNMFDVFTFFKMLFVTHTLIMLGGVVIPLILLFDEYKKKKQKDVMMCIHVLASVGLLGVVSIILYEAIGYSAYQHVFQTGLLILTSILLANILKDFMRAVRYRAEARIYKQLSEQDKLTKLDNLRSFDMLLEKLENGTLVCENAALLFMDVNFLKKANDDFGHEFGDVVLINAANCIRSTYESAGYCYRIGGDEFCVVILDPSCPPSELCQWISDTVKKFNCEHKLYMPLSIACGCSMLLERGEKKTIAKWKADADEKMYIQKKQIKAGLAEK